MILKLIKFFQAPSYLYFIISDLTPALSQIKLKWRGKRGEREWERSGKRGGKEGGREEKEKWMGKSINSLKRGIEFLSINSNFLIPSGCKDI